MSVAWEVAGGRVHTALWGLALGARQSLPRTPAQLAPGWEEIVAGSHCQVCQALHKGRVHTEEALEGACVGDYEKEAKLNTEEGCLTVQERWAIERRGTGCSGYYPI